MNQRFWRIQWLPSVAGVSSATMPFVPTTRGNSHSNRNTINNEKLKTTRDSKRERPSIKYRSINRHSPLFLLQSLLVLCVLLFGSCRKQNVEDKPLTELAKLINNTPLENVQSIVLTQTIDSSQNKTTELWRHQNIKPEQWKSFKQVLIKYLNDFDRNQLGAVMPLHTLTIECHEFEINVTLYAMKDREDTDNPFIANLTKSLAD